jgi:hypothetical protein
MSVCAGEAAGGPGSSYQRHCSREVWRGGHSRAAVTFSFGTTELLWLNLQGAWVISRIKAEHRAEENLIQPLNSGEVADLNWGEKAFGVYGNAGKNGATS